MASLWENLSTDISTDGLNNIELLNDVREYLNDVINKEMIPGAVILIAKDGKTIMHEAFGSQQISPIKLPMKKSLLFDIASLTKIVCTWISILKLVEYKLLDLDSEVKYYLNLPGSNEFGNSTISQILKHTSGLPERTFLKQYGSTKNEIVSGICNEPLVCKPDEKVLYSNRGFIILGEIIEKVSNEKLNNFIAREVWNHLEMKNTFFKPNENLYNKIAPTEYPDSKGECQRGIVHDENAMWLGGVAGHAGVFSNTEDLAKFCSMLMAGGVYKGKRIIDENLLKESLSNNTIGLNDNRGYGWVNYIEEDSNYFGHTGFTGTGMWLNLKKDMFVILLSNRVHPDRKRFSSMPEIRKNVLEKSWKIY
ncbi:MAG: serine hydrolase domain-containing protein [Clostridiales bacterium]